MALGQHQDDSSILSPAAILSVTLVLGMLVTPGGSHMPLINLILIVAIIGFVLWLVTTYVPMPQSIKTILVVFVALMICFWLLGLLGVGNIYIGHRP